MRRREDPSFLRVSDRIWVRDRYVCQFCGFQAKEYQEVINLDGDYYNNKLTNMATACVFCTQCLFIQAVGVHDFGGGKLVFLPELTQAEINSLCHVLFCAMSDGTNYAESAQTLYQTLKFRSQVIENKFGKGTSEPEVLARMILEYGADQEKLSSRVLSDLRLLPVYGRFKEYLERWAASATKELSGSVAQ